MARRRYTPKLKARVVLEILSGERTPGRVTGAYGVHANSVGLQMRRFLERAPDILAERDDGERVRASGEPSGGDPGGEGASGGGGAGVERCPGPGAGTGAQPEGGATVRVCVRGSGGEGADELRDPGSRIMRTSTGGCQQCYNVRAVVDGESRLEVGTAVTDNASDRGRLAELVDEVSDGAGRRPGQVPADTGYRNERTWPRWRRGGSTAGWGRAARAGGPASPARRSTRRGPAWPGG